MMKRQLSALVAAVLLTGAGACSSSRAEHLAGSGPTPSASSRDRAWLAEAHQANLAETQVGELARKKGGSAAVRAAGAMLVTDHVAADAQVTRVARSMGVTLPSAATPADAAAARRLGDEAGGRFDRDFTATMATGHQKVIADTQAEIDQGSDEQVKNLAQTTLPVLRKHLDTLRRAAATG
jgi:putative membrane protein